MQRLCLSALSEESLWGPGSEAAQHRIVTSNEPQEMISGNIQTIAVILIRNQPNLKKLQKLQNCKIVKSQQQVIYIARLNKHNKYFCCR